MNKKTLFAFYLSMIAIGGLLSFKFVKDENLVKEHETANAGLTLPKGFKAAFIAAVNLRSARHLVAAPQGDI